MRLVCPNCDAQYEVDAVAIPEEGRDVQCSNCGQTWFQRPPELEAELEAAEVFVEGGLVPPPLTTHSTEAARAAGQTTVPMWDDADEDEAPPPLPVPEAPVAPRRGMDESLLSVLREEAEREASVRRAETPRPLEQQTDLGLEETSGAASAAKAVRERLARLRGPDPEPELTERPTARRDLLPDIEEINSTLRASNEARNESPEIKGRPPIEEPKAKGGFRSGFALALFVIVVLLVVYIAAPKIAEQFPALRGMLEAYVNMVNELRLGLDQLMKRAIAVLQGLTGKG